MNYESCYLYIMFAYGFCLAFSFEKEEAPETDAYAYLICWSLLVAIEDPVADEDDLSFWDYF